MAFHGLTEHVAEGFLSPQGRYAAAVDVNDSGIVWDAETGDALFMLADTRSVVWSPDERLLAIQRTDGSVWILNAAGQIHAQLPKSPVQQAPDGDLVWSPDGAQLAHIYDGVVMVWALPD